MQLLKWTLCTGFQAVMLRKTLNKNAGPRACLDGCSIKVGMASMYSKCWSPLQCSQTIERHRPFHLCLLFPAGLVSGYVEDLLPSVVCAVSLSKLFSNNWFHDYSYLHIPNMCMCNVWVCAKPLWCKECAVRTRFCTRVYVCFHLLGAVHFSTLPCVTWMRIKHGYILLHVNKVSRLPR